MKIEIRKDDVILYAENKWEQNTLDTIESRGISKVEFEETWDNSGGLRLVRKKEPFETENLK